MLLFFHVPSWTKSYKKLPESKRKSQLKQPVSKKYEHSHKSQKQKDIPQKKDYPTAIHTELPKQSKHREEVKYISKKKPAFARAANTVSESARNKKRAKNLAIQRPIFVSRFHQIPVEYFSKSRTLKLLKIPLKKYSK